MQNKYKYYTNNANSAFYFVKDFITMLKLCWLSVKGAWILCSL